MLNEKECSQILNEGENNYTPEEISLLRNLLISFAEIEYDNYKKVFYKNQSVHEQDEEKQISQ
jgi:hypothetical protein